MNEWDLRGGKDREDPLLSRVPFLGGYASYETIRNEKHNAKTKNRKNR